jgi:hypothetical protein
MTSTYIIVATILIGLQTIATFTRFFKYWRQAQLSGLPYTWSPVHELGGAAFITNGLLRWWYRDYLQQGKGWPRWARFMIKDWHYEDHGRATEEYGKVFLVATPSGLICYISDASTASSLLMRRKAFIKPADKMG